MVANLEATENPLSHVSSDTHLFSDPVHVEALSLLDKLHQAGSQPRSEPGYLDFGSVADIFPASSPRLSASCDSQNQESSFSKGKQTGAHESASPTDGGAAPKVAHDSSDPKKTSDSTTAQPTLESARGSLLEAASKDITGAGKFQAFEQDMSTFELRMMQQSPLEVQQFYTQMARLLSEPSSVMSESNKILLAEGMMHDAANPNSIRQGASEDCVVASMESKAYNEAPAQIAKALTDVALTGSYTTADGRVITPTNGIEEPIKNDQIGAGERSFSDQVFQVTAMNTYMDVENQAGNTPGRFEYRIAPSPVPEIPYVEQRVDNSRKPPSISYFEGIGDLTENSLSQLYQKMTGIASSGFLLGQNQDDSLPEVQAKLLKAQQTGQFPLEAGVDSESPILTPDFEAMKGTAMYKALAQELAKYGQTPQEIENFARHGGHALAIEGYDPKTETVTFMDPELGTESKTSLLSFVKGMDIEPYPQADDSFNDFLESQDQTKPFDQQEMNYLNTVPQAQREEMYSELISNGDAIALSDSELKSLGLTDPNSSN